MPVSAVNSPQNHQDMNSVYPKKDVAPILPGAKGDATQAKGTNSKQLTPDQQKEVEKLKKRDADVRAHEMAHVAGGGSNIKGGVSYSYQKGPDGVMYAIGGEVSIDVSPVKNDPRATINKMEAVKRAALAPADPSGADRSVAAAASQEEVQAQRELAEQKTGNTGIGQDNGDKSKPQAATTSTYTQNGKKNPIVNEAQPSTINVVV